jgi:hypothetical protein
MITAWSAGGALRVSVRGILIGSLSMTRTAVDDTLAALFVFSSLGLATLCVYLASLS